MKKLLFSLCFSFAVLMANAQASPLTYSGMLLGSGTAGPSGDDVTMNVTIPFTFGFYGTGYTAAYISTNGFIWLGTNGGSGCCRGYLLPSDTNITHPFIALTQTDFIPDGAGNGSIFYAVTGTAPNRVFAVHFENLKHISSADRMTGEIQLFETTNEIRLVMSSLTGFPISHPATMGIANGDGITGYAVGTRNNSAPYAITNEAWSLLTPSSALPVTLISFEAEKVSGTTVLNWSTGIEENNSYFTIERSANGQDFKPIAKINSKGNTSLGHQYIFTDDNPSQGKNFYRLVQYDIDGKAVYYGIRQINFELSSQVKIIPNPFVNQFSISVQGTQASKVQIKVFDILGRKVTELTRNITAGNNVISVLSKHWPAGLYSITVNQDGNITKYKAMKQVN